MINQNQRILLKSLESKQSIDENTYLGIDLNQTSKHLPIDGLETVVSASDVFLNERNTSNCYRFLGNVNIFASNVLFNWSGDTSYQNVVDLMDYDDDSGEYVFSQEQILKENDGWFYYQTGETQCQKFYLEPNQQRFSFFDFSGDTNWLIYLTYPARQNINILSFDGINISDGIALFSAVTVNIDNRNMTAFISPINHGLQIGDSIVLTGGTTGYEGNYVIYDLGLEDGNFQNNTFIIDIDLGVPVSLLGSGLYFYRLFNGIRSQYIGRWFKKISLLSDYEIYNSAFATNIYNDQSWGYNFNKSFDLGQSFDYLNRPITETYITFIKKQDFYDDGSVMWTPVVSGLDTAMQYSNYNINGIHTTSTNTIANIEPDVNVAGDYIFGDIVEYNPLQQYENILAVAQHRFNTINREQSNFLEGYYYQAHYRTQIREFSDYVITSVEGDENAPYYAANIGDGTITWRDIQSNDYSNNQRIPFLNGCHYIYQLIDLFIKRQDPCGLYDLGNENPVIGDCDTTQDFIQVNPIDICK